MYRFLLTPRWFGINVFVLLAIPFCIFMGSWQLSRFEDRMTASRDAEQQVTTDAREAARPLAELLPVDQVTSGKQATATGRYDKQLLVPDRQLGDREGYYVLTLLRTDSGKALPVVRGWLPGTPIRRRPRPRRRARSPSPVRCRRRRPPATTASVPRAVFRPGRPRRSARPR